MAEEPSDYSTRAYYDAAHAALTPSLAFGAAAPDEWRVWRVALVERLTALLGGFPEERGPLNATTVERCEQPGYVREKIAFESEPGVRVPAYLLLPHGVTPDRPRAALLCLHGHGRGKQDVVGIVATPRERQRRIRSLNYDYAHQLALRGYVVLAPDARGFGERAADGMGCAWAMTAGLLLGKILVGLRVWDAMRAIDYLQTRPEVDPTRIGCVGLSWGGTHTMYTAALDERVRAAVISGAFGTFKDALIDTEECACQYVPALLRHADLPDITALIAPRPLLIESGDDDPHYTREVVTTAYQTVQDAYRLLGADGNLAIDHFSGNHRFHGQAVYPWLDARLAHP